MKKNSPQLILLEHFQQFVKASSTGRRLTTSGKRITKGTITNYKYVIKLLQEFEVRWGSKLRIQMLHRSSLRMLQREKNYWNRFQFQFSKFLYNEKRYHDNYIANIYKAIKTFFNYLQNTKGYLVGNYHKSFKIPILPPIPVILLPEQLHFLITNKEFELSLTRYLKRAKDICVFGCTVGLRYADLINLKKTNIIYKNGEASLVLFTEKTGSQVSIPLPDYIIEIVHKYKNIAGRYVLPRLSSTNLNIQLKKLIKQAGWDYILPKYISHKGKMLELKTESGKSWKFFHHITAHTMRRTAITTLLIMGVPETMVKKISGHSPGSKEFYKYVGLAQEYLNTEVRAAYKKLIEYPAILPLKISA